MPTTEELNAMTKEELLAVADDMGLDVSGSATKPEVRAEIDAALAETSDTGSGWGTPVAGTQEVRPPGDEHKNDVPVDTSGQEMELVRGTSMWVTPQPEPKAASEIAGG